MRWVWIDRFVEFQSGRRAVAIKNVSLAEEQIEGYQPGMGVMPESLIVEGIAQTGGLLVAQANQFRERVVLAKLSRAVFHRQALAGETLKYTTEIDAIQPDGAVVRATSHVGDDLQAEVQMMFAHLGDRFQGDLFYPAEFIGLLRCFRLFEVGVDEAGRPLQPPPHLLAAESAALAAGD